MAEASLRKGLTIPLPVDLTNDCTRLLGQICYASSPIDPRAIRALTFLTDKVDVSGSNINVINTPDVNVIDRAVRQVGIIYQYPLATVLGNVPGTQTFYKLGSNNVIPSTTFMILSNVTSSILISNFPTIPQQMQVVSTSASDTAVGTGTQKVTIDYLTNPASATQFTRFSEIVTLNGTVPVNTIATNIDRIERFRASKVGTGAVSAGNISLQSVGGASTYERIDAGENINRTCVHFVPNNYQSIITDIKLGTVSAGGVRFSVTIAESDPLGNLVRIGQEEIGISLGGTTQSMNTPIFMKNDSNRRLSFAITVRGIAANQAGQASFAAIDIPL